MLVQTLADEGFRAVRIAAGDSVSVALGEDGQLRAWGSFRVCYAPLHVVVTFSILIPFFSYSIRLPMDYWGSQDPRADLLRNSSPLRSLCWRISTLHKSRVEQIMSSR